MRYNIAELSLYGILMTFMIVKNEIYIWSSFRVVHQWGVQTDTLTHSHIHTHTHTHTHTHAHAHTHTHTQNSDYKLTPLDISWRKVVHIHSWHPLKSWRLVSSVRSAGIRRGRAYRHEGLSALCTFQCSRFASFILKMNIRDVDDLEQKSAGEGTLSTWTCVQKWRF